MGPKGPPDAEVQPNELEISNEKLKPGIARQVLLGELDAKIAVASRVDFVVL
jgi:hypothetical protein